MHEPAYGQYVVNAMDAKDGHLPAPAAPGRAPIQSGPIALGLLLIFVGVIILLDRGDIGRRHLPEQLWPFLIVTIGLVRLLGSPADASRRRSRRAGLWLVIVGCWGAINEFHLFDLDYDTSWPLLIVAAGVMTIWRALDPPLAARAGGRE